MNSGGMNDAQKCFFRKRIFRMKVIAPSRRTMISALLLAVVLIAIEPTQAQTESVIYSFTGQPDGALPVTGLLRDAKGNLFGTTFGGGASGSGAVFQVAPDGTENVLYSFVGGEDGIGPAGGLLALDGKLYGTTQTGGDHLFGTVFELTPSLQATVLVSFTVGDGGGYPQGGLISGARGHLYGTNSGFNGGYGNGAVFAVTPAGTTILYEFLGGADGLAPYGRLVRDAIGNLYGTTYRGGASGYGTVFEITHDGTETVLYSFAGGVDGANPVAGLIRDASGNLYGTTPHGGALGYGVVFKVSKTGTETVLHSFTDSDGYYPIGGLVRDAKGNLYGTTEFGGSYGKGTVFRITPSGVEKVLYSFTGGADGSNPLSDLVFDAHGNLYGTTSAGGSSNCFGGCGVVFKVSQ